MDPRHYFKEYSGTLGLPREKRYRYCPKCAGKMQRIVIEGNERGKCGDCGFVHYQNPKPGVVVLIRRDDSVLLGKRRGAVAFGKWCLPGGFINYEEDYLSAAHREVREETGLEIEITGLISVVSNFLLPGMHTLVVVLSGVPAGGELRAGDDLDEADWFPLKGPLPPLAFESDAHIIERTAAGKALPVPIDPRFILLGGGE